MAKQLIEIYQLDDLNIRRYIFLDQFIHDADGIIVAGRCYYDNLHSYTHIPPFNKLRFKTSLTTEVLLESPSETALAAIKTYSHQYAMGFIARLDANNQVVWVCYLGAVYNITLSKKSNSIYIAAWLAEDNNEFTIRFFDASHQLVVSKDYSRVDGDHVCFLAQLSLSGMLNWHTTFIDIVPIRLACDDAGVVICDDGSYNQNQTGSTEPVKKPLVVYNANDDVNPAFSDSYTLTQNVYTRYLIRYSNTGQFMWLLRHQLHIEGYRRQVHFDDVVIDGSGNLYVGAYSARSDPSTIVDMSKNTVFTFNSIGSYMLKFDAMTGAYSGQAVYLANKNPSENFGSEIVFRTSIAADQTGVYFYCPMSRTVDNEFSVALRVREAKLLRHSDNHQISPYVTAQSNTTRISIIYKLDYNLEYVWHSTLIGFINLNENIRNAGHLITANKKSVSIFGQSPSAPQWGDPMYVGNTIIPYGYYIALNLSALTGEIRNSLLIKFAGGGFIQSTDAISYEDNGTIYAAFPLESFDSLTVNTLPDNGDPDLHLPISDGTVARTKIVIVKYDILSATSIVATATPPPGLVSKASTVAITATISPIVEGELTLHRSEDLETPIATSTTVNGVAQFELSLADVTTPSVSLVVKYAGDREYKSFQTAPLQYTVVNGVNSPLLADRTGMPADGTTAATVSSQIVAPDGSPLPGVEIALLNADTTNLALPTSATTDASGNVQFTVAGSQLGAFTYAARVQNAQPKFDVGSIALRFTKAVDLTNSSVTSSKFYVFEGGDSADVTVRLIDVSGNPLEGFPVTLGVAPTGAAIVPASANTAADGTAVFTVSKPLGI